MPADTLFASVSATGQAMIQRAQALMPQQAPCLNLVTHLSIPKGKTQADLPYATSTGTVQQLTEGDEVSYSDNFTISATSITPGIRVIKYKISKRADRFSQENLVALVSQEISRAQAQNVDQLITAQFTNFHTDNDVGSSGTDLAFAILRDSKTLLMRNATISGGPAPGRISCVIAPTPYNNLMTNLGAQGVVASSNPWIPQGLSADIMKQFAVPGGDLLGGVGIFWDGYMVANGAADYLCAMFSEKAIYYVSSQEWQTETFSESEWLGVILRADADYGVGLSPFTHWGSQITADGE